MSGRLFAQIVGLIVIGGAVLFLVNWATRSQAMHEMNTEQNAIEAKYAPALSRDDAALLADNLSATAENAAASVDANASH